MVAEAMELDPADAEERLDALDRVHAFVRKVHDERVARPHVVAALPVRPRPVPERPLRVAAADAEGVAQRQGRARDGRASGGEGEDLVGAAGDTLRTARDFTSAAKYFLDAAQHAAGLFAYPRGGRAVPARPREHSSSHARRGPGAIKSSSASRHSGPLAAIVEGWAAPEVEHTTCAPVRSVNSSETRRNCFPCCGD